MRIEGDEGNILEVAVSITKLLETFAKRLLLPPPKNSGGSGSNFNPQNTQCIPACPACPVASVDGTGVGPADRTGVVNPPNFGGGSPSLVLNPG